MTSKVGRPTVVTEEVLAKLEVMFSLGATDEIACSVANIHPSSLYEYQQKNPGFSERKAELKDMVTWQAKANVAEKIFAGDIQQSNWWLERKAKNEFSTRQENFNANLEVSELPEEKRQHIENIIKRNT